MAQEESDGATAGEEAKTSSLEVDDGSLEQNRRLDYFD
jgi:hypothetical protein